MSERKGKNILFINAIFEGDITGVVEIIKDLISLGNTVTSYILDSFADLLKNTGAKLIIYYLDKRDVRLPPKAPPIAINMFLMIIADSQYKLILTSKFFNPDNYSLTDNSFYFLAPSNENREIDEGEDSRLSYGCILKSFDKSECIQF